MLSPLCKWKHHSSCLSWALHASPRGGSPSLSPQRRLLDRRWRAGEAAPTAPPAGAQGEGRGRQPQPKSTAPPASAQVEGSRPSPSLEQGQAGGLPGPSHRQKILEGSTEVSRLRNERKGLIPGAGPWDLQWTLPGPVGTGPPSFSGVVLTEPHCKAGDTALPCPPRSPAPSSFSVLKTGKLRPKEVTACGWAQGLGFPPRLVGTMVTSAGNVPSLCLT